jgi:6-pyruvoyl tetrahydropterin synthase
MRSHRFYFEASRRLHGDADSRSCQYAVEVISGEFAGELSEFAEYVRSRCDRRHLNDQFVEEPTAENLARHFYRWLSGASACPVVSVRVRESVEGFHAGPRFDHAPR